MNSKLSLTKLLFPTLPLIAVILSVASIVAHNFLATSGQDLKSLQSQAQVLAEQNISLRQHIADSSSLTTLKYRAEALGFISPDRVVFINSSLPLAQR